MTTHLTSSVPNFFLVVHHGLGSANSTTWPTTPDETRNLWNDSSGLPMFEYPPLVVFVDEVHELGRRADRFLSLFEPRQRRAMGEDRVGDFSKATFLAATTDSGRLPQPFLTRFRLFHLDPYTADEIAQILAATGIAGSHEFRVGLAWLARLNPRDAKNLAAEFMENHRVHGFTLDESGLARMRQLLDGDIRGLRSNDRRYLESLLKGPRGLDQISNSIRVDKDAIARDIEPYLAQLGFIQIGRGGREITGAGRQWVTRK